MEDKKPKAITERTAKAENKETSSENIASEHIAKAKAQNLSISTKHCIEMCSLLRYKTTAQAKRILEEVIDLKRAVPFKRFKRDVGHKPGMAAGRYPQKAAKDVLKLIESVEANAQNKGLNTANLKIIKMLANRAAVPITGGRRRTGTKRTHLEIEVKEVSEKKKEKKTSETKKEEVKAEPVKEEVKKETPKTSEKKEAPKKPEVKTEPVKKETPKVEQKEEVKKEIPKKVPSAHDLAKEVKKAQTELKPEGEQSK